MKAIVLCAGRGTRLGGMTRETPKPMLPICGIPLLEYTVRYLVQNGIRQIGINLHYFPDKIRNHFRTGEDWGVRIHYVHESELRGTAGALPAFREWIGEEDVLVVYGDILTGQPVQPLWELHRNNRSFATLLLHRRSLSNSFVTLDPDGRINNFLERPGDAELRLARAKASGGALVNSGIQLLSPQAQDYIQKQGSFDLARDVYARIFDHYPLYGMELQSFRIAIDSPERYRQAEELVRRGFVRDATTRDAK